MIELILLLVLLLVICQIVYTTVKIGISPMPSSFKASKTMFELSQESTCKTIIDVGSGFGFLALYCALKNPNKKVIGYEISLFPWIFSIFIKYIFRCNNLTFYRKNFLDIEFLDDCLIICYLFPDGMKKLEEKLNNSNLRVISNTFSFKNRKPTKIINVNDLYKTPIYVY